MEPLTIIPNKSPSDLEKGFVTQDLSDDTGSCSKDNIEATESGSQKDSGSITQEPDGRAKPNLISSLCCPMTWLFSKDNGQSEDRQFTTIVREMNQCEYGYPYLAAFMESSEDFMIYRRFGFLHTRLLLQKQDQLAQLEVDLDFMDQEDKFICPERLQNRSYDETTERNGDQRIEIFNKIEKIILEYDELLLKSQALVGSHRPTTREHTAVVNFMKQKSENLVASSEADYIRNREDLITLRPGRETAWLDAVFMRILQKLPRRSMIKFFCRKETKSKTTDPIFFLPRNSRVHNFVNGIVLCWVLILFTVPIYALYHVGSKFEDSNAQTIKGISMGILFFATMMFALGLAFFTKAKRHETLAASAAYCALLVVFIANLGADAGKKSGNGGK